MQTWEYLTLNAFLIHADIGWYAYMANEVKLDDSQKKITLTQRMSLLGQDGWELVAEHLDVGQQKWEYIRFYISAAIPNLKLVKEEEKKGLLIPTLRP